MRKSTLFVSAALTTFMLAVMFGVASAYQKIVQNGVPTEAVQVQEQQAQPANAMAGATSVVAGAVTAEQAAALASSVIGRNDLYAAENAQLDGVDAYLVTFSSGDIVYVSLDGKIMSISKLPVTYVNGQPTWVGSNGGGGGGNNSSNVSNTGSSSNNNNSSNSNDHGDDDDDDEHGGNDNDHEDHDD